MLSAPHPSYLYHVGLFALELSSRVYTLRAKSNAEAELWVKTLSKLRAQGVMSTLNPTGTCCLSFFLSFFLTLFFSLSLTHIHSLSHSLCVCVIREILTTSYLPIDSFILCDPQFNLPIECTVVGGTYLHCQSCNKYLPLTDISIATIFIYDVAS